MPAVDDFGAGSPGSAFGTGAMRRKGVALAFLTADPLDLVTRRVSLDELPSTQGTRRNRLVRRPS